MTEAQEAVQDGTGTTQDLVILDALDRGMLALSEATDALHVAEVRDHAMAYKVAAKVLERRDIQVKAATLVARAERVLAKLNPPKPTGGDHTSSRAISARAEKAQVGENKENADTGEKLQEEAEARSVGRLIADARQAHAHVSDERFEELVKDAETRQEPLTRKAIKAAGRAEQRAQDPSPPAPRPQRVDPTPPAAVDERTSMRNRIAELEKEVERLKGELTTRQHNATSEARIQTLQEELEQAKRDAAKWQNQVTHKNSEIARLKKRLKELEGRIRSYEGE